MAQRRALRQQREIEASSHCDSVLVLLHHLRRRRRRLRLGGAAMLEPDVQATERSAQCTGQSVRLPQMHLLMIGREPTLSTLTALRGKIIRRFLVAKETAEMAAAAGRVLAAAAAAETMATAGRALSVAVATLEGCSRLRYPFSVPLAQGRGAEDGFQRNVLGRRVMSEMVTVFV